MQVYFITFRSVTPAQQAEQILQQNDIFCMLRRTPRSMEPEGCGYCLRIRTDNLQKVIALLKLQQISYRRIFKQGPEGTPEEIRL